MGLTCERTQQPAGQGGFHTGELRIGQASLRYIYDCGSINQTHIDRAVVNYANSIRNGEGKPVVDILFISHFDEDHIKGLKTLFKHVTIKKAVIPYIDEFERLYLVARAVSRAASKAGSKTDPKENSSDGVDEEFRACMSHPYRWLMKHEIETIIVVGGEDDDNDEALNVLTELSADRPKILKSEEVHSIPIEPGNNVPFLGLSSSKSEPLYYIRHSIPFTVATGSAVVTDWWFLTYVHPWEEKRKEFRGLIEQRLPEFAHRLNNDVLAEMLSDSSGCVKVITECYNEVWKKAIQKKNATTMSLYSGPRTPSLFSNTIARGKSGNFFHLTFPVDDAGIEAQQRAGWLLTGDAPIKEKSRLTPFLNHYFCIKDFVGVLMLPHHGSNANFNPRILSYFNAPIYSMAAGMSERLPHATVQRAASAAGLSIVTNASASTSLTFTSQYVETTAVSVE